MVYCCVSENCHRLGEALKSTKKLDWTKNLYFESLLEPHKELVEEALVTNGAEKLCDNFFDYKMWLPPSENDIKSE